jgi:hypothetical protein
MNRKTRLFFGALSVVAMTFTAQTALASNVTSTPEFDILDDGTIELTQGMWSGSWVVRSSSGVKACSSEISPGVTDQASPGATVGPGCKSLYEDFNTLSRPAANDNLFEAYFLDGTEYSSVIQDYPHIIYWEEAEDSSNNFRYSYTLSIDARQLSGAPGTSATETAAPTPAPYRGPAPSAYSVTQPSPGDEVVISGKRMNLVSSCTVDGVELTITDQSADSLTIEIPETMKAGLKDLVMTGSAGKLTVIGAFSVEEPKVNVGSMNGHIAVYAKGHKGKTLSWKIAGKWFSTTVQSDYQVLQRKTVGIGRNVNVDLYIDGEKQLSTSVTTK